MNKFIRSRLINSGYYYSINSLAILHNGDLVSASNSKAINIWNSQNGSLKHTLTSHSHWVISLIVLHNGNLVSASYDGSIIIWNYTRAEKALSIQNSWATCLTLLPNTDFASGSERGEIKIWTSNGGLKKTFKAHDGHVGSLLTLQNGFLASGSCDKTIKVWDREGNLKKTLVGHTDCVYSLAQLDNGHLVSGSTDKTLRMWNEKGNLIRSFKTNHEQKFLTMIPNGNLINIEDDHMNINIQSLDQFSETLNIKSAHRISCLAVFSNGDIVFASSSRNNWSQIIEIWKRQ